jgi:hypothetical protein
MLAWSISRFIIIWCKRRLKFFFLNWCIITQKIGLQIFWPKDFLLTNMNIFNIWWVWLSAQLDSSLIEDVGYQLLTKLFKLFLPSYSYLKYLCYMHILLRLWNTLNKFIYIYLVKFNMKYFNAWDDGLSRVPFKVGNICMGVFTSYLD